MTKCPRCKSGDAWSTPSGEFVACSACGFSPHQPETDVAARQLKYSLQPGGFVIRGKRSILDS